MFKYKHSVWYIEIFIFSFAIDLYFEFNILSIWKHGNHKLNNIEKSEENIESKKWMSSLHRDILLKELLNRML